MGWFNYALEYMEFITSSWQVGLAECGKSLDEL